MQWQSTEESQNGKMSIEDGLALSCAAFFTKITNSSTQKLSLTVVIRSSKSLGEFLALPDMKESPLSCLHP